MFIHSFTLSTEQHEQTKILPSEAYNLAGEGRPWAINITGKKFHHCWKIKAAEKSRSRVKRMGVRLQN